MHHCKTKKILVNLWDVMDRLYYKEGSEQSFSLFHRLCGPVKAESRKNVVSIWQCQE